MSRLSLEEVKALVAKCAEELWLWNEGNVGTADEEQAFKNGVDALEAEIFLKLDAMT